MRIIAAAMAIGAIGFGLFTIVFGIVNPAQAPHAFHNAIVASLLIVLSAPPVIAIARAPRDPGRPLVMLAAIGVAALATMALSLTLDPFTLPFVVLVGVLWLLAPSRGDGAAAERPSLPLLALSALVAVLLVPYALQQAELQRADRTSEHAAFFHWVEMSFYATAIPLLGVVVALRPTAHRLAAWCAGVALVVIGVASLLFAAYASALPAAVAGGTIVAGAVFIVLGEITVRGRAPGSPR
jgi:hypothetical protein